MQSDVARTTQLGFDFFFILFKSVQEKKEECNFFDRTMLRGMCFWSRFGAVWAVFGIERCGVLLCQFSGSERIFKSVSQCSACRSEPTVFSDQAAVCQIAAFAFFIEQFQGLQSVGSLFRSGTHRRANVSM